MDTIIKLFTETGLVIHVVLLTAVIILLHVLLKEE